MCVHAFRIAAGALLVFSGLLAAQNLNISSTQIRAHVKYLASDELEGRGVGTRGGKLATDYIAAQLQAEGVKPGGENGTYFQRVPLAGVTTSKTASLSFGKNEPVRLRYITDFVGTSLA